MIFQKKVSLKVIYFVVLLISLFYFSLSVYLFICLLFLSISISILYIYIYTSTSGGGNTGKTTLLKQLQILYATGFSVDDKLGYRYSIYDNVLEGMLALVKSLGLLQLKLEPQFEVRERERIKGY